MTAVLADPTPIAYAPGWGIHADLTPPELLSARRLKTLRRSILMGLAAVVVLVVVLFGFTMLRARQAASGLAQQQAASTELTAQQSRYASVTSIQNSTTAVRQQLSGLMGGDVAASGLLASIRSPLPRGTVLDGISVTINAGGAAAAAQGAGSSLDTSGATQIGRVTLSGTTPRLGDVAAYVDALGRRPGLVDVVPVTSQANGKTYTFTVDMTITGAALTNRYTVAATGTTSATAATTTTGAAR